MQIHSYNKVLRAEGSILSRVNEVHPTTRNKAQQSLVRGIHFSLEILFFGDARYKNEQKFARYKYKITLINIKLKQFY